jgi:myo-inositol 2-dehydrogenase/D-chiro-inositol 1-dehydrogenase
MRRFDPAYTAMKAALDRGDLGRAMMMHNFHRNVDSPPRFTGAMAITNSAPHEFDAARFVLGTEFRSISATQPRRSDALVAPVVMILRTAEEQLVTIEVNNHAAYGYDVRGELVGERASVTLGNPVWSRSHEGLGMTEAYAADWRPRFAEAYRLQDRAFVAFVNSGKPSPVASTTWDGLVSTLVADKGVEALATGATVQIDLPRMPDFYRKHTDGGS